MLRYRWCFGSSNIVLFNYFVVLIAALFFFTGCKTNNTKDYQKLTGFAQGSTYAITYYDSLSRDFSFQLADIFERVDLSLSLYRENSTINHFNQSEKGVEIDSLMARMVEESLLINEITHGAFDITVGPLVKEWGFHGKRGELPDQKSIQHLQKFIGRDMIVLNGQTLSKCYPEVKVDFNAIAQGFTVDLIAEFFNREGVTDYLIEVGGEIRSGGLSPRGDRWLVGIDKPEDNALSGENIQVIIGLTGESLVTSGNYRKFFVKDGVKYSHTIDPQTGYPVTHTLLSATVLDQTATRADALATAFMVMGTNRVKAWLSNNHDVDAYLIYSNEHGEFEVWMSEGMKGKVVR